MSPPCLSLRAARTEGFALIAVLWISVIISGTVLAASYVGRLEMRTSRYPLKELQALGIALGGVEMVRSELLADGEDGRMLKARWNEYGRRPEGEPADGGGLRLVVEDEESKINLATSPKAWLAKFRPFLSAANSEEMIDALSDWQDPDSAQAFHGAEEEYYSFLDPPRHCKNGPLDCLDELRLIKGFDEPGKIESMKQFVTVRSNGKINVNTAPAEVLSALPGMDDGQALRVVARRSGPDCKEGTEDDQPFGDGEELRGFIGDDIYGAISRRITFVSTTFTVRSSGTSGRVSKTVEAVLEKNGGEVRIKSWRELE